MNTTIIKKKNDEYHYNYKEAYKKTKLHDILKTYLFNLWVDSKKKINIY